MKKSPAKKDVVEARKRVTPNQANKSPRHRHPLRPLSNKRPTKPRRTLRRRRRSSTSSMYLTSARELLNQNTTSINSENGAETKLECLSPKRLRFLLSLQSYLLSLMM
jgi:hypothetical protein